LPKQEVILVALQLRPFIGNDMVDLWREYLLEYNPDVKFYHIIAEKNLGYRLFTRLFQWGLRRKVSEDRYPTIGIHLKSSPLTKSFLLNKNSYLSHIYLLKNKKIRWEANGYPTDAELNNMKQVIKVLQGER